MYLGKVGRKNRLRSYCYGTPPANTVLGNCACIARGLSSADAGPRPLWATRLILVCLCVRVVRHASADGLRACHPSAGRPRVLDGRLARPKREGPRQREGWLARPKRERPWQRDGWLARPKRERPWQREGWNRC